MQSIPKLPFANYDVIVYFGGGLFSLPFIFRYTNVLQHGKIPQIVYQYPDQIVNTALSLFILLFATYVLGHGLSYASSVLIETFLFRSAGYPADVINALSGIDPDVRNRSFRRYLGRTACVAYVEKPYAADWIRAVAHLPVVPLYGIVLVTGFFGFYITKIPAPLIRKLDARLASDDCHRNESGWFKLVERRVLNENPNAVARMYNYVVIFGLLRLMSLVFLTCIWLEFWTYFNNGGVGFLDPTGHGSIIVRLIVLYGAYLVSFSAFGKYNRRYAEEAILSYAVEPGRPS